MAKKEDLDIKANYTPTVEVPHISQSRKEMINKRLEELMQEEGRLVRGLFQCFENPGASQKITCKKYPTPAEMRKRGGKGGLEPFAKVMTDGQEYEIPLYVARFLNGTDKTAGLLGDFENPNTLIGTCSYAIHGFKMAGNNLNPSLLGSGSDGYSSMPDIPVPTSGISKRVKRYGFQSLEFAHGAA